MKKAIVPHPVLSSDSGYVALTAIGIKDALQAVTAHVSYLHGFSVLLASWDEVAVAGNVVLGMFLWRSISEHWAHVRLRTKKLVARFKRARSAVLLKVVAIVSLIAFLSVCSFAAFELGVHAGEVSTAHSAIPPQHGK